MLISGTPVAFGLGAVSLIFLLHFHGLGSLPFVVSLLWSGLCDCT